MTSDILPSCVDNFLDNLEATLCLPMLLVIIICTLQFIMNHTLDIICTIISVMDGSIEDGEPDVEDYNSPISARIREIFSTITCSLMPGESTMPQVAATLSSPTFLEKLNLSHVTGESSQSP